MRLERSNSFERANKSVMMVLFLLSLQRALGIICSLNDCDLNVLSCHVVQNDPTFCEGGQFKTYALLKQACFETFGGHLVSPADQATSDQVLSCSLTNGIDLMNALQVYDLYRSCTFSEFPNLRWLSLERNPDNCNEWIDATSGVPAPFLIWGEGCAVFLLRRVLFISDFVDRVEKFSFGRRTKQLFQRHAVEMRRCWHQRRMWQFLRSAV